MSLTTETRLPVIEFTVEGQPVSWKRARGGGSRRYTDPMQAAWQARVVYAALEHISTRMSWAVSKGGLSTEDVEAFLTNKLLLVGTFRFSDFRLRDFDNCIKAVADCLQGVVYTNDSQIRRSSIELFYGMPDAGVDIRVEALGLPENIKRGKIRGNVKQHYT